MKCPWQTKTTIIPAIYHPPEMARHEQHITEFADCIEDECPFWTAIKDTVHRQEGGYKTFVRYKCAREV